MDKFYYAIWGVGNAQAAWLTENAETTNRAMSEALRHGFTFNEPDSWAVEYCLECDGNEYQADGAMDARTRYNPTIQGWASLSEEENHDAILPRA